MKKIEKKLDSFQRQANFYIEQLQHLIDEMPYHGDSSEESQKVCLQIALNELEYAVTGTTKEDFKKSKVY